MDLSILSPGIVESVRVVGSQFLTPIRHAGAWARRIAVPVAMALAIAVPAAVAQQTAFAQLPAGGQIRFSYNYRDAAGSAQRLAFELPSADIEAAMALFRDYAMPHLYLHIEQALRREAQRAGVTLQATQKGDGASFRILADSAAKRDAFDARMDGIIAGARGEWLRKHARRAVGSTIYVDHPEA
ncbi:MAG TPA: hypothetical protein VJ890_24125, partial [Vineibacter sp.]|nr:hypothetical protein [Vineibacter sp.]